MDTIYEGSLTGTVTNGVMDVVIQQVPKHCCRCSECQQLDTSDAEFVAICIRYIDRELDFTAFHVAMVLNETTPFLGPSYAETFGKTPCRLVDAAAEILFEAGCEMDQERTQIIKSTNRLNETEFRERLRALVYGYQIRQRTVHCWEKA